MELQVPLHSRKILKKKNKLGGLTLPGFKTFYKTTVIGADRTTGRENGTAGPALQPGPDARPISGKTAEGEQESFRHAVLAGLGARAHKHERGPSRGPSRGLTITGQKPKCKG